MCKIKVADHVVNFYIAHLHAEYNKNNDDYFTHRLIQVYNLAQLLENTRGDCSLQILAGDLNIEAESLAYRLLLSTSGMKDSYLQKPSDLYATNECINNSYTSPAVAAALLSNNKEGIRIDYVLYRDARDFYWEVEKYELPLSGKIENVNLSYSDHEAVHVEIKMIEKSEDVAINSDKDLIAKNIKDLKESILTCNKSLKTLDSHRFNYSIMAIGLLVILFNVVEISPGHGLINLYMIVKFLLCALTMFFIFMASLWNTIERHGILSGKLSMEIALQNFEIALKEK